MKKNLNLDTGGKDKTKQNRRKKKSNQQKEQQKNQDNTDQDSVNKNNSNNKKGGDKMNKKDAKGDMKGKFLDGVGKDGKPRSPQHGGVNLGSVVDYDDPEMFVTNISEEDISNFLMETVQELNPVKVEWKNFSYEKLTQSIRGDHQAAIDTISKITGAQYQDGKFSEGYERIPILVFDKCDVVHPVDYREDLGAISRDVYELDFNKIRKKNHVFLPKHGIVTSFDNVNERVQININIINTIVHALGFKPEMFGTPNQKNKLFLHIKQEPQQDSFKVVIVDNKYMNDKIRQIINNI